MSVRTAIACLPGALPGGLVRTTFFNGMVLSQDDLEVSERYWRIKRQLTCRTFGQGVVWGLRLTRNEQLRQFQLSPGYALDCCGNDLVVPCGVTLRETDLLQDPALIASLSTSGGSVTTKGSAGGVSSDPTVRAAVVLQYVECPEDPRPVFSDPCTSATDACETARVRETTRVILAPPMPPPTTPIDAFWQGLQDFRASLSATEVAAIFPATVTPGGAASANASGAAANDVGEPFPFTLIVHRSGIEDTVISISRTNAPPTTLNPANVAGLSFELHAQDGWGFWGGTVSASGTPLADVAAGSAALVWSPIDPKTGVPITQMSVDNLGYTSLFGTKRFLLPQIAVSLNFDPTGKTFTVTAAVPQQATSVTSVESCFDPLRRLVFEDGTNPAAVYPKGIVLGAAYAVMAEALKQTAQVTQAQHDLATMVYSLVWKTLFGADLSAAARDDDALTQLNGLLARLFAAWCAGFYYPGPRCTPGHHGVYLGEVTLDRAGVIRSFDPWARRYVLTGPLLTHWAGLFGVAPLDVIVSRLARVICCVAKIDLPVAGTIGGTAGGTSGPAGDMTSLFGAGPVVFAIPAAVRSNLEARNITFGTDQVSPSAFVVRLVRALAAPAVHDGGTVRLVTLQGQAGEQLQILEPVPTPTATTGPLSGTGILTHATQQVVAGALAASTIAPLARAPLTDLAVEIAFGTPIPGTNHPALDAALKAHAIASVGDLLATNPETIAAFVPPVQRDEAWFAAVNDVFTVSREEVEQIAGSLEKVVAAAKTGGHAIRRASFADPTFVAAAAKAFPKRKALVTEAAARVARAGGG